MKAYVIWFCITSVGHFFALLFGRDPGTLAASWLFSVAIIPGLIALFTGDGNGANCEPAEQDNVIRAISPVGPDTSIDAAAAIVHKRESGSEKWYPGMSPVKHLYAHMPTDQSGGHKNRRMLEYMLEGGRAERNGVIIHLVGELTQDMMGSTNQPRSNTWHNTAPTAEGGTITTTTHTSDSSGSTCILVALAVVCLGIMAVLAILIVIGRLPS